ncbi:MAG: hypothetical protein OXE93_02225 [bacterium]|nr:hypothetical protein [bacterium]
MDATLLMVICYMVVLIPTTIWLMRKNLQVLREILNRDTELIDVMLSPLPRPAEGWEQVRLFELMLFAWDAPKEMAEESATYDLYDIVKARRNAQIAIKEYKNCENWWAAGTVMYADVISLSHGGQFSKRVAKRLAAAVRYASSAKAELLEESREDMLEALGDHII